MFAGAKQGSKEFEMYHRFKLNLSRMAAYKSYHVTRQLRSIKTKDSALFDKQAKGIIKKYNRYQAAEYNTAVARARTAEQFAIFQKEADIFPNIEWIASRSANKRDAHIKITGTILPQNHPFWESNQPGNLWNCKCDWRTTNKPVTADPGNIAPAAQGLEGNPAKTGEIFTNEHPYISSAKKTKDIEAFVKQQVFNEFKSIRVFDKGKVLVHPLVDKKTGDYETLNVVARHFAKNGEKAYILPKAHFKNRLYQYIFDSAYERKCPDLLIGNTFYEVEGFTGEWNKKKISHMISRGLKQSNRVIIDVRKGKYTDNFIRKIIYGMLNAKRKITEVWIIEDNNTIRKVFESTKPDS